MFAVSLRFNLRLSSSRATTRISSSSTNLRYSSAYSTDTSYLNAFEMSVLDCLNELAVSLVCLSEPNLTSTRLVLSAIAATNCPMGDFGDCILLFDLINFGELDNDDLTFLTVNFCWIDA